MPVLRDIPVEDLAVPQGAVADSLEVQARRAALLVTTQTVFQAIILEAVLLPMAETLRPARCGGVCSFLHLGGGGTTTDLREASA
jgi:hypothetical protein